MPAIHSFHIVFTDGSERDVKAGEARLDQNGNLIFRREDSMDEKLVIARGAWKYYEYESQDDRG